MDDPPSIKLQHKDQTRRKKLNVTYLYSNMTLFPRQFLAACVKSLRSKFFFFFFFFFFLLEFDLLVSKAFN